MTAILDGSFSKPFVVDFNVDRILRQENSDRIIYFETKVNEFPMMDLERFFVQNDPGITRLDVYPTLLGIFCLDRFFSHIKSKGLVQELHYIQGKGIREGFGTDGEKYRFTKDGKIVEVFDEHTGHTITEIQRVAQISKEGQSNFVVGEVRVGKKNRHSLTHKVNAVRGLIGNGTELCCLRAYSIDSFEEQLTRETDWRTARHKKGDNMVSSYLDIHPNNRCLVYSATTKDFRKFGEMIYGLRKPMQRK